MKRLRLVMLALFSVYVCFRAGIFAYNQSTPFTVLPSVATRVAVRLALAYDQKTWDMPHRRLEILEAAEKSGLARTDFGEGDSVRAGKVLPRLFYEPWNYGVGNAYDHSIQYVMDGHMYANNPCAYYVSCQTSWAIMGLRDTAFADLTKWLAKRRNILPPQRLDSIVWVTLYAAPHFECNGWSVPYPSGVCEDVLMSCRQEWREMLRGTNPVYRLLSVSYANVWAENWNDVIESARVAFDERANIFHGFALRNISALLISPPVFGSISRHESSALANLIKPIASETYQFDSTYAGDWYPREILERLERSAQATK